MATNKKEVKVRDLKPSKDAKGGAARSNQANAGGHHSLQGKKPTGLQGKGSSAAQGFGHRANS